MALFAIAMPMQPPSIVEIRAKLLLFQSKHKLDFTPMGIDSRCYKFFLSSFLSNHLATGIFSRHVISGDGKSSFKINCAKEKSQKLHLHWTVSQALLQ